mmetsp:Transcript_24753/g.61894  ORF Transcript_24753/g.61894 Transcript_24753/m.61894 type:complete len:96 (-) Transcript_24753:453-740(-)
MSLLVAWIDKKVTLVTNDGRNVIGVLRGFDQMCNVVLEHTVERIFSEDAGAEEVPLGLFVVKGDNLAIIGEVDPEVDAETKWTEIKGAPIGPVIH